MKTQAGQDLRHDEGVWHGSIDHETKSATVVWKATPDAIRAAGEAGHDLIIAHESLYSPYDVLANPNPPKGWQEWKTNRQRRELLEKYDLTLLRLHGSIDKLCIFDDFAERLELGEAVFVDDLVKVYEIPPCPLHKLVQRVKKQMNMPALRVADAGDMNQLVSRVGLPWGGVGLLMNVGYQNSLIEQNCNVFIAGETDNYGFRFAAECGIPMIETSHELSENPGFEHFTEILTKTFPSTDFHFYENKCIWQIV